MLGRAAGKVGRVAGKGVLSKVSMVYETWARWIARGIQFLIAVIAAGIYGTRVAKDAGSEDGQAAEWLFALGIAGYQGGHMDILSRIAIVFSDTDEVDKLLAAGSAQEIFDLLNTVNQE